MFTGGLNGNGGLTLKDADGNSFTLTVGGDVVTGTPTAIGQMTAAPLSSRRALKQAKPRRCRWATLRQANLEPASSRGSAWATSTLRQPPAQPTR